MNVFESIMTGLQEAVDFESKKTEVTAAVLTADPLDNITAGEQHTDN